MTFRTIALKMFKADIKKYKLFILCNLSSIAILYSFISISVNQQFMNNSIVDPMISRNIYAPTFLALMFTGIFIPYSQSIFMKARQKDYGILLTIGMTEKEVRNSVLIENLILCIVSLIMGLEIGTFLSLCFLEFIRKIIGIDNIDIKISILPYKITTIYVSIIFIISLIVNVFGMIKSTIYEKIKYAEKAERGRRYSITFIFCGIVFTIVAFIIMIVFYKLNGNMWLLSLFFSILGSALVFFNGEALHLYNFGDWRNSNAIVSEVNNKLLEKNNLREMDGFYKISSRIEAYNIALKSSNFLISNIIYVSILLYFAVIIMIHFKFKMEYNDEKRKYFSLYRIGIKDIEIKKIISQKILVIYNLPLLYAIIMNLGYSYYINSSYGYGFTGVLYAFITSIVIFIIHFIVSRLYFSIYYKNVILELN